MFRFLLSHQESDAPGTLPLSRSLETFCECGNDLCSYTLVSSLRWRLAYGQMDGDRTEAGGMGKLVIACRADLDVALCCACGCTHECGRLSQHQAWKSGEHVCGGRESARVPTISSTGKATQHFVLVSSQTRHISSKSQRCFLHLHLQTVPPIVPCRNTVLLGSPGSKFIFSIKSFSASLVHTLNFLSALLPAPEQVLHSALGFSHLSYLPDWTKQLGSRGLVFFSFSSQSPPENRVPWC